MCASMFARAGLVLHPLPAELPIHHLSTDAGIMRPKPLEPKDSSVHGPDFSAQLREVLRNISQPCDNLLRGMSASGLSRSVSRSEL